MFLFKHSWCLWVLRTNSDQRSHLVHSSKFDSKCLCVYDTLNSCVQVFYYWDGKASAAPPTKYCPLRPTVAVWLCGWQCLHFSPSTLVHIKNILTTRNIQVKSCPDIYGSNRTTSSDFGWHFSTSVGQIAMNFCFTPSGWKLTPITVFTSIHIFIIPYYSSFSHVC